MTIPHWESKPRLPEEFLKPKFWQIAADHDQGIYATPFQKFRVLKSKTLEYMAGRMSMSTEEVRNLELGHVRPLPMDILSFCTVLSIHPLDLYDEPYGGTPLPRELRDTLVTMAMSPAYDFSDRIEAKDRLQEELDRADAMLRSCREMVAPLMRALGYSHDLQSVQAPAYDISTSRDATVQEIIEGGSDNPRAMINAYLNAYQIMLEEELDFEASLVDTHTAKQQKNEKTIRKLGVFLYGEKGCDETIKGLQRVFETSDDHVQVREWFIGNPEAFAQVSQKARTEGMRITTSNGNKQHAEFPQLLALFQYAVRVNKSIENDLQKQNGVILRAYGAIQEFTEWRAMPETQRLLDWFENRLVLGDFFSGRHTPARYLISEQMMKMQVR